MIAWLLPNNFLICYSLDLENDPLLTKMHIA